ncbi:hypothetical protein CLU79DRAFT_98913 [Phycomyces nitens]|nr:hypothetical protein CLU79DRAFT_98913 [Phycomyces nitens]
MSALALNISIATLNCNSLAKTSDPTHHSDLIRFLRQTSSDIIALQETYASTSLTQIIHTQFHASSLLWEYRCGLVSLSPLLSLERIPIPEDD